jgi:uncharacterized protein (DUF433 family)
MELALQTDPVPLREDAGGAIRVGETRVLLDVVIQSFEDGDTPETIVQQFDTLRLSDVYAVIAYYLRHRDEVRAYLERREGQAEAVRRKIEATQGDLGDFRARLLARRGTGSPPDASPGQ